VAWLLLETQRRVEIQKDILRDEYPALVRNWKEPFTICDKNHYFIGLKRRIHHEENLDAIEKCGTPA